MSGPLGSQQWMYASGGFYDHTIDNSLRFEDGDSAYLNRTPASAGNRKTWTWSGWVKRGNVTTTHNTLFMGKSGAVSNAVGIVDNQLRFYSYNGSDFDFQKKSNAVLRDPSAWYHIVAVFDSSNATASDRAKIYINGERVTSFASSSDPSLNFDGQISNNVQQTVGSDASSEIFDGYLADVNFIDGQALDPTSFGEFKSGIWIPKDTSGLTFGTNGFRLAFADSAAIGDDTSGNTNDWTANNLVASDVVPDSPTNNFATMNPLAKGTGTVTFSEGNLKSSFTFTLTTTEHGSTHTLPQSGKWYWEQRFTGALTNGSQALLCGIMDVDTLTVGDNSGNKLTSSGDYVTFYTDNNTIYINNSLTAYTSEITDQTSAIVGFAVDMDNGHLWVHVNGTYINGTPNFSTGGNKVASPNTDSTYMPFFNGNGGGSGTWIANFGQDSTFAGNETAGGNADENGYGDFAHPVPSGYLSLCSANLPTGAIDTLNDETPEDYFNTVLYSGNGSTNAITGVGFQPNFTWFKSRSGTTSHHIADVIRGTYTLIPNSTVQEFDRSADGFTSLDSDGFTLNGGGGGGGFNVSGQTFVSWNWKANGAGVSNTDGSITSTVSVGATSQQNWFSIVSYTGNNTDGATVGHGFGVVPSLVITKSRSATSLTGWMTKHKDLASNYNVALNRTDAAWNPSSNGWVGDLTSDTTFSLENGAVNGNNANQSGVTYIAYCFANAENLCRVGSYVGNGSADGTFIYTGFRPAGIIAKNINDGTTNWWFHDNERLGYNANNYALFPNLSQAEDANVRLDILSNGFKIRNTAKHWNTSGQTFIYLAIAEQPFKYANAR